MIVMPNPWVLGLLYGIDSDLSGGNECQILICNP